MNKDTEVHVRVVSNVASIFSLDLERIVFVSVVKKGCDSVVFKSLQF